MEDVIWSVVCVACLVGFVVYPLLCSGRAEAKLKRRVERVNAKRVAKGKTPWVRPPMPTYHHNSLEEDDSGLGDLVVGVGAVLVGQAIKESRSSRRSDTDDSTSGGGEFKGGGGRFGGGGADGEW